MIFEEQQEMKTGELLNWAYHNFGDEISIASSFGAEDVVLIDLASKITKNPRIFTLDTGRLHQETYSLIEKIRDRYHIQIEIFFPQANKIEEMVAAHGPDLFYQDIEFRKLCCQVRKIEPLKRALTGLSAWICGLRKEQSPTREEIKNVETDEANQGLIKINPLVDWTLDDIWNYIKENDVPYNSLHDQNFPSIGCAPCTRAILPGEDIRAGRWWWESPEQKECGLHERSQ